MELAAGGMLPVRICRVSANRAVMKLLAVVISAVSFLSAGAAHYDGLDEREPMQSTEHVARPHVGNVPYGENYPDYNWNLVLTNETGTIINQCKSPGLVALAFDDGPWVFTNQLLDLLDQLGVHATFFVTGDNMGKGRIDDCSRPWPSILYRMYESGHQIASHTWTHQNLDHVNHAVQQAEMVNNEIALQNLFGWIPTYTRPPYLECTAKSGCPDLLGNLGYHVITSNIDTKDYLNDGPYQVQKSKDLFDAGISTQSTKNSYIVLAHDTHSQTATNLTAFMTRTAKDRSYKLVTVGECLGDPKANWYRSVPNGKHACKSIGSSTTADSSTSTEMANTTETVPSSTESAPSSTRTTDTTSTQLVPLAQTKAASSGVGLTHICRHCIYLGVMVFILGMHGI
ncbi:chitin deacetylase [Purpureocillium lilacinum]|uniref:Chitin deacetylase n=1 Tax=Purpureocillium lilacinum TaxID=33203 RepID=A0A179HGA3_PURLI|nr:chitin deacetylase [Purpureocillium lilacinum]OAQ89054.1 chitin deacetylase [Purpureocillium lilacinum]